MKKIIKISLIAAVATFGMLQAKTYHDKTFLMPRSHNQNIAMENATWHKLISHSDEGAFGGSIQATGFYQESTNEGPIGKYFGINNYRFDQMQDFIQVGPVRTAQGFNTSNFATPLSSRDIFHTRQVTSGWTLADKIVLKPSQESWGAHLGYHQKLDRMVEGLFFRITTPIIHVKNSLGYTSTGGAVGQRLATTAGAASLPTTGTLYTVIDYLTGRVSNNDAENLQQALTKAKWHNSNSKTALADVDVEVGYNFLYEKTKRLCMHGILTIPTGNTPQGEYLFEAVAGNGDHWGAGFGLDSCFRVWTEKNSKLDIIAAFNYRHFFRGTETRTLGFRSSEIGFTTRPDLWGHYKLIGENTSTRGVFPAANVLTREVEVIPGCQFDGMLDMCLTWNKFSLDVGYNLFAKKAEDIRVKHWDNNRYAVAAWDYDTSSAFDITVNEYNDQIINKENLLVDVCKNPSVATHKLFGGLGYIFSGFQYPIMLGGGGSWEFVTDNDCLRQWAVWGKLGLAF